MIDLLLPSTDGGVAIQFVVWLFAAIIAVYLLREHRDLRLLAIGVFVFLLGLMTVRAIH